MLNRLMETNLNKIINGESMIENFRIASLRKRILELENEKRDMLERIGVLTLEKDKNAVRMNNDVKITVKNLPKQENKCTPTGWVWYPPTHEVIAESLEGKIMKRTYVYANQQLGEEVGKLLSGINKDYKEEGK